MASVDVTMTCHYNSRN